MKRVYFFAALSICASLWFLSCSHKGKQDATGSFEKNEDYLKAQEFFLASNNDSAMIYINHAIAEANRDHYSEMADIYLLSSKVSNNFSLFERAMEDALKALEISEEHHFVDKKATALLSIGNIYFKMYNDEEAENYLLQAKAIAEEHHLESEMMQIYGTLGHLYVILNAEEIATHTEGLQMLNKALGMAQIQSDTLNLITYLAFIGNYYIELNRRADADKIVNKYQVEAKKYLDEAMRLALLKNATNHANLVRLGLIRWCRTEKNYEKALEYAYEIMDNTEPGPNNSATLIQVYDHMVGIYSYLGNARYAIAYHNQFRTEMMKQSDYKLHYVLQEMLVKYETAKKELAIEQHKSEIKQYRTRLFIFIGGIIGAGILIVLLVSFLVIRSRRNRELAEMNTIKDKFFSIISHDLKNPAIAQNDALQLLAKNVETWDTPKLFNYARLLAASSNNLVDLIKDLLNWAQIQTGKKIYNPVTFNLVPKLQPDIETIKNMAAQKEIAFEAVMPQEAIITGDQNMLITVVRNLLSNAVKFTHSGGAVTLEIKAFGDKGIKGGGGYIVSVADTGTGISPKQLQNLFSIARQQSHEGTAGETGTGLGLIVCKEFLEKHGNQLHIESEEGKGSKVWFEI